MAVWFMRGLRCLFWEESTWFASKSPPTPDERKYQQMIVETTCCACANLRLR
jgi:hypothetical protein